MTEVVLKCSKCKQDKPVSEFYKTIAYQRGYTYTCKECSRKSANNSRLKKKEGGKSEEKGMDKEV